VNCLNIRDWKNIAQNNNRLKLQTVSSSEKLGAYNDTPIELIGAIMLPCIRGKIKAEVKFHITNKRTVIGGDDAERLNFVKRIYEIDQGQPQVFQEFSDVFDEKLGRISEKEFDIEVQQGAVPIRLPP